MAIDIERSPTAAGSPEAASRSVHDWRRARDYRPPATDCLDPGRCL